MEIAKHQRTIFKEDHFHRVDTQNEAKGCVVLQFLQAELEHLDLRKFAGGMVEHSLGLVNAGEFSAAD